MEAICASDAGDDFYVYILILIYLNYLFKITTNDFDANWLINRVFLFFISGKFSLIYVMRCEEANIAILCDQSVKRSNRMKTYVNVLNWTECEAHYGCMMFVVKNWNVLWYL